MEWRLALSMGTLVQSLAIKKKTLTNYRHYEKHSNTMRIMKLPVEGAAATVGWKGSSCLGMLMIEDVSEWSATYTNQ
jgi:hypothetical protein